jgi:hypothetical protein
MNNVLQYGCMANGCNHYIINENNFIGLLNLCTQMCIILAKVVCISHKTTGTNVLA